MASINPGAATHFSVSAPAGATAGAAFTVTVTALDANNNVATSYLGTVHFKSSDTGNGVVLPGDYPFAASDNGSHTFTNLVTLVTAGSQTVTATDTSTSTITGYATVTVGAASASKLVVAGYPSPVSAGSAGNFTVTAQDKYGNTATGYAGTVAFSSSDPHAQLPGNSPLNNGTGNFSATFQTLGTQSLTATDTVTATITGTQSGINVVGNLPIIYSVTPNIGPTTGGTNITIYGTYLTGATAVYFGGVAGTILPGGTLNSLPVVSPAQGAGVVDVTVVTPAGTSKIVPNDQFTYTSQNNGPTVTGVSPNSGSTGGNYQVTITGTNLANATAVYFGNNQAFIGPDSPTSITVNAPAGTAGTVDVTVVTAGGTSPTSQADKFTYTSQNNGPTVTGVSPNSGSTGGNYQVTITGTNLANATAVYFGNNLAFIGPDSPTSITVNAPAGTPGTVDVTVVTAAGTSPTSQADKFTYTASGPTVTKVSPSSGPTTGGYSVTITGTNFTGATAVYFGTTKATINGNYGTQLSVTAPAHTAGTVDVTVVTPAGTSPTNPNDQFTYTNQSGPPTVTGVSPNSGPTTGGNQVTITGTNLGSEKVVYFGTIPTVNFTASPTSILVTAPAHSAGKVDVTVVTASGTSPTNSSDKYTYTEPSRPTVGTISPTRGPTGGGTTVIITGTGFTGATQVSFGGALAIFQVFSDIYITATSPMHAAGTVDVTVTTPAGTSATGSADKFTYTAGPSVKLPSHGGGTQTTTPAPAGYLLVEILTDGNGNNTTKFVKKSGQ